MQFKQRVGQGAVYFSGCESEFQITYRGDFNLIRYFQSYLEIFVLAAIKSFGPVCQVEIERRVLRSEAFSFKFTPHGIIYKACSRKNNAKYI